LRRNGSAATIEDGVPVYLGDRSAGSKKKTKGYVSVHDQPTSIHAPSSDLLTSVTIMDYLCHCHNLLRTHTQQTVRQGAGERYDLSGFEGIKQAVTGSLTERTVRGVAMPCRR
jgi:hypothetical protein